MSHYRPRDGKDGIPGTHGKDGRDGERGERGPAPEHEWDGSALRFQDPDGTWGDFVDLEGPAGKDGMDGRDGKDGTNGKDGRDGRDGTNGRSGGRGPVGPMPEHEWKGTSLRFEEPDGEWGPYVNLKGEKGDPGRNGVGGMGPPGPQGPPGPGGSGTIEAGDGIEVATVGDVTTVSHGDTSSIADFTTSFTGGVVMQQIATTYDEFGHAQTIGVLGVDLDDRYVMQADALHEYVFGQEYLAAFHNKLLSETPALMTFSGDSTTFGTNITDPNYILSTAVLRIGLNRRHALTAANAGHSGASTEDWRTLYLAGDLATNPDLYILRWGLNDPFWGRSLADFEQSLRDGLATARASKPIADMSILLMVPNTANDTANGRDAAWMEATRPIIRQAARDYQCAFIDTFKLWEDTENAANLWMDEPLGPGVVIHPLNVMNSWISSKIGELIYPDALDPVKTEVRATLSTSQSFSTGAFSTVVFDTVSMDARGEYDASTGEFTCTQTGKYLVNAQASIDFSTDDRVVIGSILVNASEVVRLSSITFYGSVASSAGQAGGTAIIDLVAGDVVTFNTFVFIISGGTTYTVDNFPFSTLLKISRME